MTRLGDMEDRQIWTGLAAYTGKKQPPLYPPLDGGKAVTNPQKACSLLRFLSSVCAHQSDDDPRWDAQRTSLVRAYLSKHASDFSDLQGGESYNSLFTVSELSIVLSRQ